MTSLRPRSFVSFAVLLVLVLGALGLFAPSVALAKEYSCPQVSIQATVGEDGTLRATEERTFDFDGTFSAVWWELGNNLPTGSGLSVSAVSLQRSGGAWESLEAVPFESRWRTAGGPGRVSYSVDTAYGTVYAFFNADDESIRFKVEYAISDAVQLYEDCAELYWTYVGDTWACATSDANLSLQLPVPTGQTAIAGDNVRVWGHGPLSGTIGVDEAGAVMASVPRIAEGEFADVRVLFPRDWVSSPSSSALGLHKGVSRLDNALAQEQAWADEANRQRVASLIYVLVLLALCLIAIVVAIVLFLRFGKEHKPRFQDEYWRDVPEKGVSPAVIGRLMRWNAKDDQDITVTLMSLANQGALALESVTLTGPDGRAWSDYRIVRKAVPEMDLDSVETATMELLFDTFAGGDDQLYLSNITQYGKENPEEYLSDLAAWQARLDLLVASKGYFEKKGSRIGAAMAAVAALFAVGAITLTLITENFIPLIFMIPTAIILFIIAMQMKRRSPEAVETYARAKALKRWMQDFTRLKERPPLDYQVWGVFLVYAYVFGIAKQVVAELRSVLPEVVDPTQAQESIGYVPWYIWTWGPHGYGGAPLPSIIDAFNQSLTNTATTAQQALAAMKEAASGDGGGGFSSGFGGGGGFSIGGGGGFGGGGGAR